jgi:hypothetical protein
MSIISIRYYFVGVWFEESTYFQMRRHIMNPSLKLMKLLYSYTSTNY